MPLIGDRPLTIGELTAMVGIPVHTIRAWERRYGVLTPTRTAAGHRRYSMDDVYLLRRVKRQLDAEGVSIKLAVAAAREDLEWPALLEAERPPSITDDEIEFIPWRGVADLLSQVVVLLDDLGRIVDANVAWAKAVGMLRLEVRGQRFASYVHPHDRAKATRLYRPRLAPRRGWELNIRSPRTSALFTFDAHLVATANTRLLALVGHDLASAGAAQWPASDSSPEDA